MYSSQTDRANQDLAYTIYTEDRNLDYTELHITVFKRCVILKEINSSLNPSDSNTMVFHTSEPSSVSLPEKTHKCRDFIYYNLLVLKPVGARDLGTILASNQRQLNHCGISTYFCSLVQLQ